MSRVMARFIGWVWLLGGVLGIGLQSSKWPDVPLASVVGGVAVFLAGAMLVAATVIADAITSRGLE